jgi:predicted transcriptional regulator
MEDETLFINFFGTKNSVLKVLDFLIDNEAFDHSKTDIAKGAGISRATLFNIWDILVKNGIVTATREVGRAKMYKLDKANPIVKKFMELDDAISDFYAPQIKKEMLVKA